MTADQTPQAFEGQETRPFPPVNSQAVNSQCPILSFGAALGHSFEGDATRFAHLTDSHPAIQAQIEAQAGTVHRSPEEGAPCPGGGGA